MRGIFIACMLCLGLACQSVAQSPVQPAKPERLQLYFFGSESDPIVEWFRTNPDLARVKAGSQWFRSDNTSMMFRERYAPAVGNNLPILVMAREGDGGAMFAADRDTMPRSSSELFQMLKTKFNEAKAAKQTPIPDPPMPQQRLMGADEYFADATDCNGPNCPVRPDSGGNLLDRLRPLRDREEPFLVEGLGDGIRNVFWLGAGIVGLLFVLVVFIVSALIAIVIMRRQ